MDMNRNALWSNPKGVAPEDEARMTAFWGDDSWKKAAYAEQPGLFGGADAVKYEGNLHTVEAYRERLKKEAGFKFVPKPMPMRNSKGAVVYYLFFASQNNTGRKIVESIFKKYENSGAP
jgi:three-Cys-motif partner protein